MVGTRIIRLIGEYPSIDTGIMFGARVSTVEDQQIVLWPPKLLTSVIGHGAIEDQVTGGKKSVLRGKTREYTRAILGHGVCWRFRAYHARLQPTTGVFDQVRSIRAYSRVSAVEVFPDVKD